jgi:hypothetical protein
MLFTIKANSTLRLDESKTSGIMHLAAGRHEAWLARGCLNSGLKQLTNANANVEQTYVISPQFRAEQTYGILCCGSLVKALSRS